MRYIKQRLRAEAGAEVEDTTNTTQTGENMKTAAALITVFITLPVWFYILYQILTAINASELTWFLYWVYIPFSLFVSFTINYLASNDKP